MPIQSLPMGRCPTDEEILGAFFEQLLAKLANTDPTNALQFAIRFANNMAEERGHDRMFDMEQLIPNGDQQNTAEANVHAALGFQRDPVPMEQQSIVSHLVIASKYRIKKALDIGRRALHEVRYVVFGIGNFGVQHRVRCVLEGSCCLEYVTITQRWRITNSQTNLGLRSVEVSELTPGCKDLMEVAGCIFKTTAGTRRQSRKPIEVPSGSFASFMASLGFYIAHNGKAFLVFGPGIGRPIKAVVSIAPDVDHRGENRCVAPTGAQVESHVLNTIVRASTTEKVPAVVHKLQAQYKSSAFTKDGPKEVRRKFRSKNGSVVCI